MTDDDIEDRLAAVERRLDAAYPEPTEGVDEERVEAMAERLADVEAAVEAIEGYVGEVERIDDELERRADAALAASDDLEERVAELEATIAAQRERANSPVETATDATDGEPALATGGPPAPTRDGAHAPTTEGERAPVTDGSIAPTSGGESAPASDEAPAPAPERTGGAEAADGPTAPDPPPDQLPDGGAGRCDAATRPRGAGSTQYANDCDGAAGGVARRSSSAVSDWGDGRQHVSGDATRPAPERDDRTVRRSAAAPVADTAASERWTGDRVDGNACEAAEQPDEQPGETLLERLRALL